MAEAGEIALQDQEEDKQGQVEDSFPQKEVYSESNAKISVEETSRIITPDEGFRTREI